MPKNSPVLIVLTKDVEIIHLHEIVTLPAGMHGEWDGEVRHDIDERPLYKCIMDSGVTVFIRREEFATLP